MSNYGFTNDQGEPIMDGAAYRFEQALDDDRYADDYMERFYDNEPELLDPSVCEHANVDYSGWTAECQDCESEGLRVVNNWPLDGDYDPTVEDFVLWPVASAPEYHVSEDAGLDSYMEDRISTMYG